LALPFVTVKLVAGRSPEVKREMAKRIVTAVAETAKVDPAAVWLVFEDVAKEDWQDGVSLNLSKPKT
jgi:phenylpyruvate tautomerase PptA (4-oxalocrotonate tautomerase family)